MNEPGTLMIRHFPALLLLCCLAACDRSPASTSAAPSLELDVEGTLAAGTTVPVKGTDLQVTFVGVVEDSRCPTDVSCVWAGEVKIKLSMRLGSQPAVEREALEGRTTLMEPYRLTVTRVLPEPVSTQKLQPSDYRINLIVVKI
jgi:hypothetical protein